MPQFDVPTIAPDDELLGMYEVARELGVHHNTAQRFCWRGLIPYREILGRMVVRRQDLEAFKAQRAVETQRTAPAEVNAA